MVDMLCAQLMAKLHNVHRAARRAGSFSVMGWALFRDYAYPRTGFVAKNGHGCYFHKAEEHASGVERAGWNPGWEVGHGYVEGGANVCIRDSDNNKVTRRHGVITAPQAR